MIYMMSCRTLICLPIAIDRCVVIPASCVPVLAAKYMTL